MSIPRRTDRAMVRINVWRETYGPKEYWWIDEHAVIRRYCGYLAKATCMRWFGHVLRRDKEDAIMRWVAMWKGIENGDDHGRHGGGM